MLLAVVWVAADGRLLSPRVLIGTRIGAGILFVAAVALRGQSAVSVAMFHELCAISFVALLASSVFAAPDSLWRRALARPFLAGIGTISFSLYIWHEPILLFLSDHTVIGSAKTNFWLIAVLLLVLSVPIAFVSYWVIEYPVGHLRSLFAPGGRLRDYYADDRVHLAMVEDHDEDQPPRRSLARQGAGARSPSRSRC
jgi:peptidoglycan/LPS O-acetylase OafA/YrhL